jgi:hypothetical protein
MATKSAMLDATQDQDPKYLAEVGRYLDEIAAIRRGMKKTDAEIRRLEVSSRRKLDHIRSNLHVQKSN